MTMERIKGSNQGVRIKGSGSLIQTRVQELLESTTLPLYFAQDQAGPRTVYLIRDSKLELGKLSPELPEPVPHANSKRG
jgi:hypothetical protein